MIKSQLIDASNWNQMRDVLLDKIYAADKLAAFHPGGPLFVKVRISGH